MSERRILDHSNSNDACPRCGGEMKPGMAIMSRREFNSTSILPIPPSTADNLKIIDVLKCSKCGYSRSHD